MVALLPREMPTQPLHHTSRCVPDQHANIRHAPASLLAEKRPVPLHKLDEETLNLYLEIGRKQVNPAPLREIDAAQIEPDLLPLRAINGTHAQGLRPLIKKSRITEVGNQGLC
jgi:hypothetical protein